MISIVLASAVHQTKTDAGECREAAKPLRELALSGHSINGPHMQPRQAPLTCDTRLQSSVRCLIPCFLCISRAALAPKKTQSRNHSAAILCVSMQLQAHAQGHVVAWCLEGCQSLLTCSCRQVSLSKHPRAASDSASGMLSASFIIPSFGATSTSLSSAVRPAVQCTPFGAQA